MTERTGDLRSLAKNLNQIALQDGDFTRRNVIAVHVNRNAVQLGDAIASVTKADSRVEYLSALKGRDELDLPTHSGQREVFRDPAETESFEDCISNFQFWN